jgi:hypothetical protein
MQKNKQKHTKKTKKLTIKHTDFYGKKMFMLEKLSLLTEMYVYYMLQVSHTSIF